MPTLERLLEQSSQGSASMKRGATNVSQSSDMKFAISPDFRLWLTTFPVKTLPVSILIQGIKITYEQPKGVKNLIIRAYCKFS
jgi:hypothetical protein